MSSRRVLIGRVNSSTAGLTGVADVAADDEVWLLLLSGDELFVVLLSDCDDDFTAGLLLLLICVFS